MPVLYVKIVGQMFIIVLIVVQRVIHHCISFIHQSCGM